jgi:hypothetical protein
MKSRLIDEFIEVDRQFVKYKLDKSFTHDEEMRVRNTMQQFRLEDLHIELDYLKEVLSSTPDHPNKRKRIILELFEASADCIASWNESYKTHSKPSNKCDVQDGEFVRNRKKVKFNEEVIELENKCVLDEVNDM